MCLHGFSLLITSCCRQGIDHPEAIAVKRKFSLSVGPVTATGAAAVVTAVVGAVGAVVAVVVGPNVTRRVELLAIGIGASGGLPTLYITKLDRRAVSNFALLEFVRPKGTLGVVTLGSEGIVVTFLSHNCRDTG